MTRPFAPGRKLPILCLMSMLSLTACGGGDSPSPLNTAPVANAGPAQTVDANSLVKLSGSGSDANSDLMSYVWTLAKPANSFASLINPKVTSPTFIADIAGTYTATLLVNDGTVTSAPSSVTITARVPVEAFIKLWDGDQCGTSRRLYLIDEHLVYTKSSSTTCADSGFESLYESAPTHKLCTVGGSSAQPCSGPDAQTLLNAIRDDVAKSTQPGQSTVHAVKQLYSFGP